MPGPVFRAYVEQMLAQSLRPGDVVVLDNLAAHKVAGVREAVHATGARTGVATRWRLRLKWIKLVGAFRILSDCHY
jgi:hypothetical protein